MSPLIEDAMTKQYLRGHVLCVGNFSLSSLVCTLLPYLALSALHQHRTHVTGAARPHPQPHPIGDDRC